MIKLNFDKRRAKRLLTRSFTFDADIELSEWQIEELEKQILEEAKERFGQVEVVDFSFRIPVKVKCVLQPDD